MPTLISRREIAANALLLALGLPLLSSSLLLAVFLLEARIGYANFVSYIVIISAGHILAFVSSVYLLRHSFYKLPGLSRGFFLGWLVLVQMVWRISSIAVTHIDCDNSCDSSIVPQNQDFLVAWIVLILLLIAAAVAWLRMSRYKFPNS